MPVRVLAEESSRAAIEAAAEHVRVDRPVVLVDWNLPDAAEQTAALLPQGAAVIALCPDQEALLQAFDCGVADAVLWPAEPRVLQGRVDRAVKVARAPFLERLHELVADSVEFTTPEAILIDVNPSFEAITGYSRDHAVGKTPASLFRAEVHDPEYYKPIGEALANNEVWRGQLAARRHDGSLSFMQATICSVRDDRGREVGHFALKRDTSRDHLARSAAAGAENRMQQLMDRAAEAVLVLTPDGQVVDLNRGATTLLDRDRGQLVGARFADFTDDAQDHMAGWASLTEEPRASEAIWTAPDGTRTPVELSTARVAMVGTEFILVIARDISDRRRAELAARRATRQLEQLNERLEQEVLERTRALTDALAQQAATLDNLADGLVAIDPEGRIERLNPRVLELLGAQGHYTGLPAERLSPELARIGRACLGAGEPQSQEMPLPDGVAQVTATPIVARHAGTLAQIGCVMLVRDVTLATEVDRMKTDFIATVSHELRTPLTSVLGFAKLAIGKLGRIEPHVPRDDRRASKAMDQVRSNLEIIAAEGSRLSALINDVLDISKMEAGRVDWNEDQIDPAALVDHVIDVTAGLFEDGGPRLVREVEPDLPELVGDQHRLIQVLINLVSNAVKFTDEGSVTVTARETAEGVEFAVHDTGGGIPTEDLDAIFDKFRQARNRQSDRPRGTGLGLPISKAIVEHHGGTIGVESAVGAGSRFWFVLPTDGTSQSHPPAADHGLAPLLAQIDRVHDTGPADILVVDDDPNLRELMRELLTDAGHRVRLAENGTQAIDMVRSNPPELLILDVVMPGLSGFDVAAVLRSDPRTETLPILVVSILADERRGAKVGVDRYLTKPVDSRELVDAINALLHGDRASRRVLIACDDTVQMAALRAHLEAMGDVVVGTCDGNDCEARATESGADLVLVVGGTEEQLSRLRSNPALTDTRVLALVDP